MRRALRETVAVVVVAVLLASVWTTTATAQADLRGQCSAAGAAPETCTAGADAAEVVQVRVGLGMAGGNPVPGTASTLGMRLGSMPRIGLGGRMTGIQVDAPDVGFTALSLHLDGSVGLYQGLSLLPTVGGFGSVDLLGSVGVMPFPRGRAHGDAPVSWALGGRLGILRESFTAPGISVSAMYRSVGNVRFGEASTPGRTVQFVQGRDVQHLRLDNQNLVSYRAVVGKRFAGIGLLGGVGHDRFRADATVRVPHPMVVPGVIHQVTVEERGMRNTRNSAFVNASLTMLILNLSAEAGWQQGGDRGTDRTRELGKGAAFAGIAGRLAI
jgi:hypothetical protein